ncbi:MAG: hypothetical protein IM591_11430 [Chitinophagaceae bacterium]|jgi:hypothetical protein|nr:hypothetical protein [Chitinophagaceae bacterium]
MKKNIFVLLLLLQFLLTSFIGNTQSYKSINTSYIDISITKDTAVYAYITSIKNEANGVLLFVDFIQYYSNEEAVLKAKERGDADTLYKNRKMIISVPGNYYIINESKRIRKYFLSRNTKFNLQLNSDRQHPISENSLNSFLKIYKDSPFILHIVDKKIISISEVFLP